MLWSLDDLVDHCAEAVESKDTAEESDIGSILKRPLGLPAKVGPREIEWPRATNLGQVTRGLPRKLGL
jgi:hypothetical protein